MFYSDNSTIRIGEIPKGTFVIAGKLGTQKRMVEPTEDKLSVQTEQAEDAVPVEIVDPQQLLIDALTFERDSLKDQLLRTMAEAQNVQRRMRAQAEGERKFASEPLARDLVLVLDNFERMLKAAEKGASQESLLDGILAIDRQLRKTLESHHIVRIEAQGTPFDPVQHEAITTAESEGHEDDHVLEVLESGYSLHGRVIRPARVKVVKNP